VADSKSMEKRALIAIALSVAVLFSWQLWMAPPPPPATDKTPPPDVVSKAPVPPPTGARTGGGRSAAVPRTHRVAPAVAEVVTPLYRVSFAADGSVTEWIIEHRGDKPLVVGGALRPLALAIQRPGQPAEIVALKPETSRTEVDASHPVGTLVFS